MIYWKCLLFGHKYYVVQEFNSYSRRIACEYCPKSYGMSDDVGGMLIEWCPELEELHKAFSDIKIIKPWRFKG